MPLRWLLYLLRARNLHGVHSPFVFAFNLHVLNATGPAYVVKAMESRRQTLLRSTETVEFIEFGAGSRVLAEKSTRKVADLTKTASASRITGPLLSRLVAYFGYKQLLELGGCTGIGSGYLGATLPSHGKLTVVEGNATLQPFIEKSVEASGSPIQPSVISGLFDEVLPTLRGPYDLVFVDGNHREEPTLQNARWAMQRLNENGVVVLDDIRWSKGMYRAWKSLSQTDLPPGWIAVDIGRMGFLFKRTGQASERFTLRYKNLMHNILA